MTKVCSEKLSKTVKLWGYLLKTATRSMPECMKPATRNILMLNKLLCVEPQCNNRVKTTFNDLCTDLDNNDSVLFRSINMGYFINYFKSNWILKNEGKIIMEFNIHDCESVRTNNSVEAQHRHYGRTLKFKSNIWKFLTRLGIFAT